MRAVGGDAAERLREAERVVGVPRLALC